MSTRTTFPGTRNAPVTPAGTGVRSVWAASAVAGPIIVQRAVWGMEPSDTAQATSADEASPEEDRVPTCAA